jgi:hypothetical protein
VTPADGEEEDVGALALGVEPLTLQYRLPPVWYRATSLGISPAHSLAKEADNLSRSTKSEASRTTR